ncbi:MAG: hypothetical protein KC488_00715, partial [Candidatus Cloacimonetes bacterium]|nr:hypothetical protein [Candidatus Cloacimonadota bacterium]
MRDLRPATLRTFLLVGLVLLAGCAYSLKGTLPPHLKTIAIPLVENRTAESGIAETLTDLLTDRFLADGLLSVSALDGANSRLDSRLLAVTEKVEQFTDQDQVTGIRVTLKVEVAFVDLVEDKELWKTTFNEWGTYDPASETRDQAIGRAV